MSSACTTQRLVRCRVKDFVLCCFARRIRLEEKSEALSMKSADTRNDSIVFEFTSEKKSKENGGKSVENCPSHSKRMSGEPHVADEDYLVFCFGEDGAIDIINDDDDNDEEQHQNITIAHPAAALHKGDEKDDEIKDMKSVDEVEQPNGNESKMEQFESCDSNLSDTSSGSFAFPILKIEEWIGSPVHMPDHGNQSVRLHCCRF